MQLYKSSLTLAAGLAALLAVLVSAPAAYAQSRTVVQVTAGQYHSCALLSDGSVQCWGDNTYGQSTDQAGPFTQISAGDLYTCGLKSDGSVHCWGSNVYGQASDQAGPFTQISAGDDVTCGVKTNGDADCWGNSKSPVVGLQPGPFTQVGMSDNDSHACALVPSSLGTSSRSAGVYCWPANSADGAGVDHFGAYTQISVGGNFNCARRSDGSLDCWGGDFYGQSSPPCFPGGCSYTQVTAGHLFACGNWLYTAGGTIYPKCWGYNYYGLYGAYNAPPVNVPSGPLAAGYGHVCAWDASNVVCWGRNDKGQATPTLCLGGACGGNPLRFAFQGFYPPLELEQTDPPKLNKVEAGKSVPLKFSLGGYKGLNVIASGYPASQSLDCVLLDPIGSLEPVQSAGDSGLTYDPLTQSYTYVWKTDSDWAGTCRVLSLKLTDGSVHLVAFQFQ